jgi:alpha-mannosidase
MALKRAENSDEFVIRMVELSGKPEPNVRVAFASPIVSAREVNGQEQPLGPADIKDGELVASFTAYQPLTFAVRLKPATVRVAPVKSEPVVLHYDLAAASNTGSQISDGFDGKGDALPAEMLPSTVAFHGVAFQLAPAKTGAMDAVVANGQTIALPHGDYNRVYVLAAATGPDEEAAFKVGGHADTLKVEDWGGFIGQWDDRQWIAKDVTVPGRMVRPAHTEHDDYAQMVGIRPGFIKRAELAWYCSHHHDSAGKNVAYSYSYLFGYSMPLPAGATTITLPSNSNVRILAISVARENPEIAPAQPLYDTLGRSEPGVVEQP